MEDPLGSFFKDETKDHSALESISFIENGKNFIKALRGKQDHPQFRKLKTLLDDYRQRQESMPEWPSLKAFNKPIKKKKKKKSSLFENWKKKLKTPW